MEYLRWILLVAGIAFVLIVYMMGRSRSRQRQQDDQYESQEELPEFSARDFEASDEGVGEVRIVARDQEPESNFGSDHESSYESIYDSKPTSAYHEPQQDDAFADDRISETGSTAYQVESAQGGAEQAGPDYSTDIIKLYILAKSSARLMGDKINSAARSSGLVFGEMNIFHRLDANDQPLFSMANMVEPGSFDADTLHDLETPGLLVFMQLSAVKDASSVLDDMLQSAYRMSELLDAQLCNDLREPITQKDTEYYRDIVAGVSA